MKEYQVTCINKSHNQGTHDHITHIGNTEDKWRLTKEEAIRRIEKRPQEEAFYTIDKTTGIGLTHVSCRSLAF